MTLERRPAVFLDRDGTLLVERPGGWVLDPADVRLLPGAAEAVRALNRAGHRVVVITNQSAVARGLLPPERLRAIHEEVARRLARHGAHIDLFLHCPHHPTEGRRPWRRRCACRKPARGMILEAARRLPIARRRSCVVGDDLRDVLLARRSPIRPILVRTGKGAGVEAEARRRLGRRLLVAEDLREAVRLWLETTNQGS